MSITLTIAAAEHMKKFLVQQDKGGQDKSGQGNTAVRVGVKPSGCTGFSYVLEVASEVGANDEIFEAHGVKVIVDRKSMPFIDGMELDYTKEGLNSGLKFNNPNVKDMCGCGESFNV